MRTMSAAALYLMICGGIALAGSLAFTVVAVYYVTAAGMNPLQLVLVGTVLEAAILVFEVPTGVIADTYSRRLSVIIGMFVLGGALLLEGSLPVVLAIMLAEAIRGIGETFISGALDAWLADEVGPERVGPIAVRAGQVGRVVGLLGAALSAALATIWLPLPILAGGAVYLALGVLLVAAMPETGFQPVRREGQPAWKELAGTLRAGGRSVRRSPALLSLVGVSLFVGLALEGFHRLQEAHLLANFAFPELFRWPPVAWFGVISVGAQLAGIVAAELFGRRMFVAGQPTAGRVLLIAQGAYILTIVAFGAATSFELAVGALLLNSAAGALIGPLDQSLQAQVTDSRTRATALSMRSMANAFGQTVGGPAVGALGTAASLRAAMLASALLLSPALLLYARLLGRGQSAGLGREEQIAAPASE